MRDKGEQEHWIKNNTSTPSIILVVEDDEGLLRLIQKNLQRAGFQTEGALNGVDAIAYLVNNQSKLILLDYRLPDISGKQVIESLTEQHRSVPFIIMTGHGDEKVAVEMMKLGARDYLVKDAEFLDVLPSVVKRVVEQLEVERRLSETELKLKESEEQYHDLIEFANVGIIAVENDTIVQINKRAEEIYGYSKEELISQSLDILILEKHQKKYREILNAILKSGKAKKMIFEEEGRRKDGSSFPLEISFSLSHRGENTLTIIAVVRDITDRKQAEKDLRETKDYLDNIIESSLDSIVVSDGVGNVIKVNKSFMDLLGYTKEEIIGKHVMELSITEKGIYEETTGEIVTIGEEFFADAKKMTYEKLFKEGMITNWQTYYLSRERKIIPIEQNIVYLYNEEGNMTGAVGVIRDITERKKVEKEIREAKEFLENLIKTSSDAIVVTDHQGNITLVNDAMEMIAGYSRNELVGKHVSTLRPPDEEARNNIDIKHDEFFKNGRLHRNENIWQRKDGQHIFVESNLSILRDKNGETVGAVGFNRDITERIKYGEALKISEEKYRSVVENANDAICSTNEEGIILSFNKKAEEIFGYASDEIVGKSFLITLPPDQREKHQKWLEKYGVTKSFLTREPLEVKLLKKNGQEIFTEITYSMIEVGGTKIIYCIVRDVTERKKMEQQLLQSEKLKSLGELSGGVAHDFNNVLAAILGRVQLLRMRLAPPPGVEEKRKPMLELHQGLEIIEKAALDGAETVRRIQEFSRRRAGDKGFTRVDINELIKHALEFTRAKWKDEAESKGIKMVVKKELSQIPPTLGSEAELREVLINLINNALDAMPQGGRLTIRTFKIDHSIGVMVKDTGIGIPQDMRERIFDPFFTTKGPQSTGLGLSVSYGIINRHRGTITVDSEEGKGTTFTISLHIAENLVKEERKESAPENLRKAKILVIDDEEGIRSILKDVLINAGHEVEVAFDGMHGIELFKKQQFDLVITDLGMPLMSGWQVAEKMKGINKRIPVALITGWNVELKESEMKENYVDLIIKKPFAVNQVLRLVQEGMELRDRFKAA